MGLAKVADCYWQLDCTPRLPYCGVVVRIAPAILRKLFGGSSPGNALLKRWPRLHFLLLYLKK